MHLAFGGSLPVRRGSAGPSSKVTSRKVGRPGDGISSATQTARREYGTFLVDPEEVVRIRGCSRGDSGVDALYTQSVAIEQEVHVTSETLGSGSSGPVKSGTTCFGGRRCAVKSLCKKGVPAEKLAAIASEAEMHLALDHPHLVRLERVYETASHVHLVLEHLEGGEVLDRLRKRSRFEEPAAAGALRQMLMAVAYMHRRQVAHRDLKLGNFMFEQKGGDHIKLIDFGFAAQTDGQDGLSRCCGTVEYVAPEVLGTDSYTEKVDMWSMGIVAYTLLCGRPPWIDDSAPLINMQWFEVMFDPEFFNASAVDFRRHEKVTKMVKRGKPKYSKSLFDPLSADARDFVRSLLVVDPSRRPSATQTLHHPFLRHPVKTMPHISKGLRPKFQAPAFLLPSGHDYHAFVARFLPRHAEAPMREEFLHLAGDQGVATADRIAAVVYSGDLSAAESLLRVVGREPLEVLHYSDFLGLMLKPRGIGDTALQRAFAVFDVGTARDGEDCQVPATEPLAVLGKAIAADLARITSATSSEGVTRTPLSDCSPLAPVEGAVSDTGSPMSRGSRVRSTSDSSVGETNSDSEMNWLSHLRAEHQRHRDEEEDEKEISPSEPKLPNKAAQLLPMGCYGGIPPVWLLRSMPPARGS